MDINLLQEYSQQQVVTESAKRAKPTSKDHMHKLIYAEEGVPDGTLVAYISNGVKLLEGCKQGRGILCSCCGQKISASQFEAHAGLKSRKKPYEHIFVPKGFSLHEIASYLTGKLALNNDGMCGVCRKGEDLLFCARCPRSFHKECINAKTCPFKKWFCKNCQGSMKRLRSFSMNVEGGVSGINALEVERRCVRIIDNANKQDLVACSLCRSYDFCDHGFNDQTVIVCDQCELEFHIGCLREHYKANLKALPPGSWFCSVECGRLNYALQILVTCGEQMVPDSLVSNIANLDVKWTIVCGKRALEHEKLLLAEAAKIFHDGFKPIIDWPTGKDFIENMTYGGSIDASDFSGVHCAILTTGSKIVTAGLFRVFGREMAELPIVATSQPYQGKGYFKLFFTCFEKLLSYLKVKKLVVPAAAEAKAMWTNKFGFRKVTPKEQKELRQTQTSMVTFSGTCLLEKKVPEGIITYEDDAFFSLSMG